MMHVLEEREGGRGRRKEREEGKEGKRGGEGWGEEGRESSKHINNRRSIYALLSYYNFLQNPCV